MQKYNVWMLISIATVSITMPVFGAGMADANIAVYPAYPARWWPIQKAPHVILETCIDQMEIIIGPNSQAVGPRFGPVHMMAKSLAGLAAQAVNDDRSDEMIWIHLGKDNSHFRDYLEWYAGVMKRLNCKSKGKFTPWELLANFKKTGVVKGYILYSYDYSSGEMPAIRKGSDHSVNAAMAAAGVLQAVMISEELESKAKQMGLVKLLDVRGKDEKWAFETFKDKLNRSFVLAQDPQASENRDIAIANHTMVIFGIEEPTPNIYAWLRPLSAVIGWNAPGEGEFVSQLSALWAHTLAEQLGDESAGIDRHNRE